MKLLIKHKIIFCLVILFTIYTSSQEKKPVEISIEQAKQSGEIFNMYTDVFTTAERNSSITNKFINENEVSYLNYNIDILEKGLKTFSLQIPTNHKGVIQLDLKEVPDSFYEYNVTTSSGKDQKKALKAKHYRGVVNGITNSLVALSFFENNVMGIISIPQEGNYNLVKNNDNNTYLLFSDINIKENVNFECSTSSEKIITYTNDMLFHSDKTLIEEKCVKLYFETEFDIYQYFGNLLTVEIYVTSVFNVVSTIYYNENIRTEISEIKIWDTPDPYTALGVSGLLTQFQNQISTLNGDLGQLLTFRTLSGGGLAAGFDGLCNPDPDQSLAVSTRLSTFFGPVPVFSHTVQIISHEFGHLFGSRHTHACVWNGNNTAIDGCSSCQEHPNPNITSCNNCPQPPLPPPGGGTIMSYCAFVPGVGVNFGNGFGLQPGNVIRNSVNNVSCLSNCCPNYDVIGDITDDVTFGNIEHKHANIKITATNTIYNGAKATYHAGDEVFLGVNFNALNGSDFWAYIADCEETRVRDAVDEINLLNKEQTEKSLYTISFVPNPTDGKFKVIIKHGENEVNDFTIKIYNSIRKLVYKRNITQKGELVINLTDQPSGLYFIQITTPDGHILNKKLIKK